MAKGSPPNDWIDPLGHQDYDVVVGAVCQTLTERAQHASDRSLRDTRRTEMASRDSTPNQQSSDAVTPGQYLTRQPGPRVLLHMGNGTVSESLAAKIGEFVPTVRVIASLDEVNLNEWDALITWSMPIDYREEPETDRWGAPVEGGSVRYEWEPRFPGHLCVINITSRRNSVEIVDFFPPSGASDEAPPVALVLDGPVRGSHLRTAEGLPDQLATLVSTVLVPAAKTQTTYTSIERFTAKDTSAGADVPETALVVRPFLYGPDDVAIAGSYQRTPTASVWLLPDYCGQLPAWTRAALHEWSELYPDRFPKIPNWDSDPLWQTAKERELVEQRHRAEAEIRARVDAWSEEDDRLAAELDGARQEAATYERALLTRDGPDLEVAVARAFAELGFRVANMDEQWDDGNRREDLRLFLEEDPDWVAIVEIKGFAKGAQETKLQGMGRWVERFLVDEHRPPDARWFVANHNRRQHPDERPVAFKSEVVETFRESGGLIIDTRALFAAVRHVQEHPENQSDVRAALVSSLGLMHDFEIPTAVGDGA